MKNEFPMLWNEGKDQKGKGRHWQKVMLKGLNLAPLMSSTSLSGYTLGTCPPHPFTMHSFYQSLCLSSVRTLQVGTLTANPGDSAGRRKESTPVSCSDLCEHTMAHAHLTTTHKVPQPPNEHN